MSCSLCGAELGTDGCRARFDEFLALEFGDPAFGIVHHLTVPTYQLQHNGYSREGWIWARDGLARFVRDGLAPEVVRRAQRDLVDSGNRDWSFVRGAKPEWFDGIVWTRTIADVRVADGATYCADVLAWAEAVLADTEVFPAGRSAPPSG